MLEDSKLKQLKKDLLKHRADLLSRIELQESYRSSKPLNPDNSDLAHDYFIQERNSALQGGFDETLEQIDAALRRINEGTFGKCIRCGKDISAARLYAIPHADFCIDCQEIQENYI